MDFYEFISNMMGSVFVGSLVGQLSHAFVPVYDPSEDEFMENPTMVVGQQLLFNSLKAGLNVFLLYKLSEMVLKQGNSDPTNGALMLFAMILADPSLETGLRSMNTNVEHWLKASNQL